MSFKNASETQNHERPESEFGASLRINCFRQFTGQIPVVRLPTSLVLPQLQ
jgi:hypothetical protein